MPLRLLELAKAIDIVVLVLASVLIVALVPEVLFFRMRACWRRKRSRKAFKNALLQLEDGHEGKASSAVEDQHLKDPTCRFYESILDPKSSRDASLSLQSLLKEVDGGRTRLANALKSVGPLAGMAGSVLGLMMYSNNFSKQEEVLESLGFLLTTTLVGTYIAIAGWLVTFLMECEKEKIQMDCVEAWERVQDYRNRFKPDTGTRPQGNSIGLPRTPMGHETTKQAQQCDSTRTRSTSQVTDRTFPARGEKSRVQETPGKGDEEHGIRQTSIDFHVGKRPRIF